MKTGLEFDWQGHLGFLFDDTQGLGKLCPHLPAVTPHSPVLGLPQRLP